MSKHFSTLCTGNFRSNSGKVATEKPSKSQALVPWTFTSPPKRFEASSKFTAVFRRVLVFWMEDPPGPKHDLYVMRPACGLVYHIYTSKLLVTRPVSFTATKAPVTVLARPASAVEHELLLDALYHLLAAASPEQRNLAGESSPQKTIPGRRGHHPSSGAHGKPPGVSSMVGDLYATTHATLNWSSVS